MKKISGVVQDRNGNAVVGASVTIKNSVTLAVAAVFAANAIGADVSPLTTDSNGRWSCYTRDGIYNAEATKDGQTASEFEIPAYDFTGWVSVKGQGAAGDGVTEDAPEVQAVEDSLSSAGGGYLIWPAGTYLISTAITKKSNVVWYFLEGAKLKSGVGANPLITTATTGVLENAGIINARIDAQTASKVLELKSCYRCRFEDILVEGTSTTSITLDLGVNTSGGLNAEGNRNFAKSYFARIYHVGTCGTHYKLAGEAGAPATVITGNRFDTLQAAGVNVRGADHAKWCDNNEFTGFHLFKLVEDNAIGVEFNSDSPGAERGVYDQNYTAKLAVDTFAGKVGRKAVVVNKAKSILVHRLYNYPKAEGGVVSIAAGANGIEINYVDDANGGVIVPYHKGIKPGFLAKITAAQTFTGAKTKADFTTEIFDQQANFDSSTSQFTAPVDGTYRFTLNMVNTTGVTAADVWIFTIEATGSSTQTYRTTRYVPANVTGSAGVEFTVPITLKAGDVVQSYVTRSSGAGSYVQLADGSFNFFAGEYVGA